MIMPKRELRSHGPVHDNEKTLSALPSTVSIVGLGCSSFSTFFWSEEEQKQTITAETLTRDHPKVREWIDTIIYAVKHCQITLLDTAPWYGHGTSEIVLGYALEELLSSSDENNINNNDESVPTITRDSICVNTKVGRYEADPKQQFDFSYEATISSTKRSLQRLSSCCEYIDVLQLHDPEFAPTLEVLLKETIPAMAECRSKGWCKALGLTGYPLEVQYQIYQHSLDRYGSNIWDQSLTYGHFNLHDSSLVTRRVNPSCESFAEFCHEQGMILLAAAPLSMGLLQSSLAPPDWHPANGTEVSRACQQAAEICLQNDVDIATLALLFSFSHPSLPCTILGMKNVEEVDKAVAVARRFTIVDWTKAQIKQEDVLRLVLTKSEKDVYRILRDREIGPYANVWKEDEEDVQSIPKYQWDGIREAHKFWTDIEGTSEDWQNRTFR